MPTFPLPSAPAYLVALSGGADSRLLLELTRRALCEREPGVDAGTRITAVHLHHGIRGEEADRDEDFCRRLCDGLGIPLVTERANIPALAEATGESTETVARRARYELFLRVMTRQRIPILLTAHHADDNLETLLDRLLRGSGTRGMGGIPPVRSLGTTEDGLELTVARPLLSWTKREILTACTDMALDYVTDSTNAEITYTRNRLRHTVIPALENAAGKDVPQRAAARLARTAREDEDCLAGLAEAGMAEDSSPDGGLWVAALQARHPAIAKRMLALLYARATADADPHDGSGTLTAIHLEALWELVGKATPESSLSLPRGTEARIRSGALCIRPLAATAPPPPHEAPLTEGAISWGEDVTILLEESASLLPPLTGDGVWASAVFPPSLPRPLVARRREPGDTIHTHGMTKKLKKLLCDKEIPRHLRDALPLICLPDSTPLWYPAAAFRDGYAAPTEGSCLRITVFLKNNCHT